MRARYFAGMGCRRGCTEDSLRELLQQSLRDNGIAIEQVAAIASVDSKSDEAGLRALADRLDLSLLFFSSAQLQQFDHRVSAASAIVRDAAGGNVAEASALAAAHFSAGMPDEQRAELIIRKCKNADATFALAAITDNLILDNTADHLADRTA